MSSNTFGDATLAPFNSTYVPNLQTPAGQLDLDWYTDLAAARYYPVPTPYVYTGAKLLWRFIRADKQMPIGNFWPFTDPGERTAVFQNMTGAGYSDIFNSAYMQQACGGN